MSGKTGQGEKPENLPIDIPSSPPTNAKVQNTTVLTLNHHKFSAEGEYTQANKQLVESKDYVKDNLKYVVCYLLFSILNQGKTD